VSPVGDEGVPQPVDLGLIDAFDDKRDGFVELVLRSTVEGGESRP
jgi:hypothetical protein